MHIGANARAQWGAVVALVVGITTAGAIGVAQAQAQVDGVELATAGPRFLALGPSPSSDPAPRWREAPGPDGSPTPGAGREARSRPSRSWAPRSARRPRKTAGIASPTSPPASTQSESRASDIAPSRNR